MMKVAHLTSPAPVPATLLDAAARQGEDEVEVQAPAKSYGALREWARPRAAGLFIALVIELLLLLGIFSLGVGGGSSTDADSLVSFDAQEYAGPVSPEPEPQPETEEAAQPAEETPVVTPPPEAPEVPQVDPVVPVVPVVTPQPPVAIVLPRPPEVPRVVNPPPAPPAPKPQQAPAAAPAARPAQGPMGPPSPAGAGGGAGADTQRVGTMPGGQPLYAAAWYREPTQDELGGYLSTASSFGWGYIACRTAPNWKVEDCVALDESPRGSNIARSVLAAAWQFKVRPPRVGGKVLVGEWVRIRITYGTS